MMSVVIEAMDEGIDEGFEASVSLATRPDHQHGP
jgi:hypothetical protein